MTVLLNQLQSVFMKKAGHSPINKRKLRKNALLRLKKEWIGLGAVLVLVTSPSMAVATDGFTQFTQGDTTIYNQTAPKVYHEVDDYTILSHEHHIYNQPFSDAVFLQRVTGDSPSSILGRLTANGHVWVMNPNGVLISSEARINTGGFLATSLVMDKEDFFSGKYDFSRQGDGGFVVNNGSINVEAGGYAILAGGAVENNGTINADNGEVILAAAGKMSFDFCGDGLIRYGVDEKTAAKIMGLGGTELTAAVRNSGVITASRVLMTANAAKSVFAAVVNNDGLIEASSVSGGGCIRLLGGDEGDVIHTGVMEVTGSSGQIDIRSGDDITLDGVVVVNNDGTISILAGQATDGSGDLYAGTVSPAIIKTHAGEIQLSGNDVRLDNVSVVTTGGGDVKITATGGFSSTADTLFQVTGSVNIDPADPIDHSSQQGQAEVDWTSESDSNVNFNPGADILGKTINVESDKDTGLGAYPNFGDIVFDGGQVTGIEDVTLDANLGNIYCTETGLIVSQGTAEFTAQLIGTVPTVVDVFHSDPAMPAITQINAGAVNVDISGTLRVNAEAMAIGISGVLQGEAGYLDINEDTPGLIIWNGLYVDHAGPMAVAYAQAVAQSSAYQGTEVGGVEDLRKGSEYYGGGVPYEGEVMDVRARFDVLSGAVFVPYPDLITDLRLNCQDKK